MTQMLIKLEAVIKKRPGREPGGSLTCSLLDLDQSVTPETSLLLAELEESVRSLSS